MKPATWRGVILLFCALTAAFAVASFFDITGAGGKPPWYGLFGDVYELSGRPYYAEVSAVDPGGPADRAGLRNGDLVDIRANTLADRFRLLFGQPLAGQPIVLTIQRGVVRQTVSVTPGTVPVGRWDVWITPFGCLWLALFAALIAWRRPYVPGNLLLSTALVLFAAGAAVAGGISGGNFAAPWAWAYIIISVFNIAFPIAVAFWAAYASMFARPLSQARRLAQWLCYMMAAVSAAIVCAQILGVITLWFDPISLFASVSAYPLFAAIFMALVGSALAIASSRGVDRQRAVWSLIPLASLPIVISTTIFFASSAQTYAGFVTAWGIFNGAVLSTPVVLTYVALNRRLIDIGFVMNRALVFTLVSTIVIGVFVLAEWAASEWLVSASHMTSTVIGMVVALGLGLSLRYIHKYVDRFVDRVFFRKRNEDDAALRRFAHEASYVTDRAVLLERAVTTVKEHTEAEEASILVRDGAASYVSVSNGDRAAISENDPAIVALRTWHKPIDLASFNDSALHGQFAFPMVSRGELVGVLTCGTKRDNEVYAPDESDALLTLAQGVGAALGVLSSDHEQADDVIAKELAALRVAVERQESVLRQLRPNST
jgi:hypothetical protein